MTLQKKLKLWKQRLRDAKSAALRDVAAAHVRVYSEAIERRKDNQ